MTDAKNTPAYPVTAGQRVYSTGMTLRDAYAMSMDRDEYGDQAFRQLSVNAKELLAGPRPHELVDNARREERIAWQLAEMKWELAVRAAIRFAYADAMIVAREGKTYD